MKKQYILFALKVLLRDVLYTLIILAVTIIIVSFYVLSLGYTREEILAFKIENFSYKAFIYIYNWIFFAFIPGFFAFKKTYLKAFKKHKINLLKGIKYSILIGVIINVVLSFGRNMFIYSDFYDFLNYLLSLGIMGLAYYLGGLSAEKKLKS